MWGTWDIHQRRGLVKSTLIGVGLIVLLFLWGLRHYDPPLERGIIIALGNLKGSAKQTTSTATQITESEDVSQIQNESVPELTESDIEPTQDNAPLETTTEQIQSQETKIDDPSEDNEEIALSENSEVTLETQPEPKPDAATAKALQRILSGQSSNPNNTSDLNTVDAESASENQLAQGNIDGSVMSESPYDLGIGLDGDGNYLLGGRRALFKEIIVQQCNQAGRVVVSIEVNQQGEVVTAMPGVRGTTNNAPCLLDPARRAALRTQFNADSKAPSRQIGKIIYVFKLAQ